MSRKSCSGLQPIRLTRSESYGLGRIGRPHRRSDILDIALDELDASKSPQQLGGDVNSVHSNSAWLVLGSLPKSG